MLSGQVTDPSGAAVPDVRVEVTTPFGSIRSAVTDVQGRYRVEALPQGEYHVRVWLGGFIDFQSTGFTIVAGQARTVDVRLQIREGKESVTVSDAASQVGADPSQNAGQILLRGEDLDSQPDDPEDLANALQMLAGPPQGPNGVQSSSMALAAASFRRRHLSMKSG